jgi:diacylglycerol kinase (ATP)
VTRRAILVHRLTAGEGDHTRGQLERQVRRRGYQPIHVSLRGAPSAGLLGLPADALIVAGGDGTLRAMLPCLIARDLPVAILPLGTANNVARSLGLMTAFEGLAMPAQRLDIGFLEGLGAPVPFVEAVGLGALAGLLDRESDGPSGEDKLQRGRRSLAKQLMEMTSFDMRLHLDDEVVEGRFLAVEALNVSHAGPSLVLAPDADPGDGRLDVFCIAPEGRDDFLSWLEGPRRDAPPGLRRRARRIRLLWDGECDLRIDDKLIDRSEAPARIGMGIARQVAVGLPP